MNFPFFHGDLWIVRAASGLPWTGDVIGRVVGFERANLIGDAEEVDGLYVFPAVLFFRVGGLSTC